MMTTQELAYSEIERLVQRFKDMPAAGRKRLNEMQPRLAGQGTASVDEEIDRRVYELYELTEEEIRIVEG